MLPQIVCCDPSSTLVAEINGGAYTGRRFADDVIGNERSYSSQSALWWLL